MMNKLLPALMAFVLTFALPAVAFADDGGALTPGDILPIIGIFLVIVGGVMFGSRMIK